MKISIYGSGYVGLVTGACLAEAGYQVLCVDIDAMRVEQLQAGICPIYEPGLEELLRRNLAAGRLRFTTDSAAALRHGRYQFIAVGTAATDDGDADLAAVLTVARAIGDGINEERIVVIKSTVPPGTTARVANLIREELARRGCDAACTVLANPEFLREGGAIADFMAPDRIVIGFDPPSTAAELRALYAPFCGDRTRILEMDSHSAELTKYAANAMLATRISFINEMATLAERVGADIEQVRVGIGTDARIGGAYLHPGIGYGGSCFPKDLTALGHLAARHDCPLPLISAVETVNRRQKQQLPAKIRAHFGTLTGRTIALWGLAFKPETDDMREAPSRILLEELWREGVTVRAYDPAAHREARRLYGERADLVLCPSPEAALAGADALAIVTEWAVFRNPDFAGMRAALKHPVIFDGRNLYDPDLMQREGFVYFGVGRGKTGPGW